MAAVLDLFSGRVAGCSTSTTMTAQFVADALVMAGVGAGRKRCCVIPIAPRWAAMENSLSSL